MHTTQYLILCRYFRSMLETIVVPSYPPLSSVVRFHQYLPKLTLRLMLSLFSYVIHSSCLTMNGSPFESVQCLHRLSLSLWHTSKQARQPGICVYFPSNPGPLTVAPSPYSLRLNSLYDFPKNGIPMMICSGRVPFLIQLQTAFS